MGKIVDSESLNPLDEEVEARTTHKAANQSRNHATNEASRANKEGEDVIQAVDLVLDTINEEPFDAVAAHESPTASMRLLSIYSRRLLNLTVIFLLLRSTQKPLTLLPEIRSLARQIDILCQRYPTIVQHF